MVYFDLQRERGGLGEEAVFHQQRTETSYANTRSASLGIKRAERVCVGQ